MVKEGRYKRKEPTPRREYQAAYRAKNKEKLIQKRKEKYATNRDNVRTRLRIYDNQYRLNIKQSIYDILGYKCAKCGFSDIRALQIDHINGDGGKQRLKNKGSGYSYSILQDLIAGSTDYQILCANCNWIKRVENKESSQMVIEQKQLITVETTS